MLWKVISCFSQFTEFFKLTKTQTKEQIRTCTAQKENGRGVGGTQGGEKEENKKRKKRTNSSMQPYKLS